ncbi:hypothetical protein FZEAL_2007 [Fusarium zealandicum]|uniref:DUF6546 domain-containing protein n=1 Tax=Fusarium zealandicum TaxID=1053134 RepID=A0A8H4US49_9HYPO|nr:hypothetical protein FZEAL_2007 [Fusarium zealandicum]
MRNAEIDTWTAKGKLPTFKPPTVRLTIKTNEPGGILESDQYDYALPVGKRYLTNHVPQSTSFTPLQRNSSVAHTITYKFDLADGFTYFRLGLWADLRLLSFHASGAARRGKTEKAHYPSNFAMLSMNSMEEPSAPSPLYWDTLPVEIQTPILGYLLPSIHAGGRDAQSFQNPKPSAIDVLYGSLAPCAAVCRDWQEFLERNLLGKLIIHQRDVNSLCRLKPRQIDLVRHLWLRVELLPYDCPSCNTPESRGTSDRNHLIVQNALIKLSTILSGWTDRGHSNSAAHGSGLTLEISVHSPSDSKHWFKNILFSDVSESEVDRVRVNRSHGWLNGQLFVKPNCNTVARLFGDPIYLAPRVRLPAMRSVKHFVIRRQTRRFLSKETLDRILGSLPNLESMQLELWRRQNRTEQGSYDHDLLQNFSAYFPRQGKSLVLFEDFNEGIDELFVKEGQGLTLLYNTVLFGSPSAGQEDGPFVADLIRVPYKPLAVWLSTLESIEHLAVSFIVDAKDCFDAFCQYPESERWQSLAKLSLTSTLLKSKASPEKANDLLLVAASAARRMPRLQIMELWYARGDQAFLFRCSVSQYGFMEIFCKGTWDLTMRPDVVAAWAGVSLRRTGSDLQVREPEHLDPSLVKSHGDAIHRLGLTVQVVHPISLRQIRCEN